MNYVRRAIEKRYRIIEKTLENITIYSIQYLQEDKEGDKEVWCSLYTQPHLNLSELIREKELCIERDIINYVNQNIKDWTVTNLLDAFSLD